MEKATLLDLLNENNDLLNEEEKSADLETVAPFMPNSEGMLKPAYHFAFNHIDHSLMIDEDLFLAHGTGSTKLHSLVEEIEGDNMLKERLDRIVKAKACNEQYLFVTAGYACIAALVGNDSRLYSNLSTICKIARAMQCTYIAHAIAGVFCSEKVTEKRGKDGYKVTGICHNFIDELKNCTPALSVKEYAKRIDALFFTNFIKRETKSGKNTIVSYYGVTNTWDNKHISLKNKFFFEKEDLEEEELKNNIDKLLKQFDKYFADDLVKSYAYTAMARYVACHSGNIVK